MTEHQRIDRIESEIHRTNTLNRQQMADELAIVPSRHTYFYIDTNGRLQAIEKPYADTYPGDEAKAIGYWRKLT